jgi:hypothetical protein
MGDHPGEANVTLTIPRHVLASVIKYVAVCHEAIGIPCEGQGMHDDLVSFHNIAETLYNDWQFDEARKG